MSTKFTILFAKPVALRGKLRFQDIRSVTNNTSNLRQTSIFSSKNVKKKGLS